MLFQKITPEADTEQKYPADYEKVVVKTLHGLENALALELAALGAVEIRAVKRAVECRGNKEFIYRACYESRLAMRVLVHLHGFTAYNEKNLYHAVQEVDWSKYMDVMDTLAIDATVAGDVFKHSQYTALLTKDAIVDQFREKYQRRPDVNLNSPTLRITVRVNATQCDLLLDASGESLHKRGYRRDSVEAPINEVLAAGMIALSGWDGKSSFADPMCGSGTLAIEAAMIACNQPPQFFRDIPLGFTKWKNFDKHLWQTVKGNADAKRVKTIPFKIVGSDINPKARNAASINAMAAGLDGVIRFEKMPFEKATPPDETGTLIMNPPYDERLRLSEVEDFYKLIGDTFKKNWAGWTAWMISSNREALKHVGLRASRRIELINGNLECSFQRFELYAGKKWAKPAENAELPAVETTTDEPFNVTEHTADAHLEENDAPKNVFVKSPKDTLPEVAADIADKIEHMEEIPETLEENTLPQKGKAKIKKDIKPKTVTAEHNIEETQTEVDALEADDTPSKNVFVKIKKEAQPTPKAEEEQPEEIQTNAAPLEEEAPPKNVFVRIKKDV